MRDSAPRRARHYMLLLCIKIHGDEAVAAKRCFGQGTRGLTQGGLYRKEEDHRMEDWKERRPLVNGLKLGGVRLPTPLGSRVSGSACPPCRPAYTTHHQPPLMPCCRHSA